MDDKTNKKSKFLINLIFIAAVIFLSYVVLKYTFEWLSPFIVGFAFAILLDPLIRFLTLKLKIKRTAWSIIIVLLLWVLICFFAFQLGGVLYVQAKNLLIYIQTLSPAAVVSDFSESLINFIDDVAPHWTEPLNNSINTLVSMLFGIITDILANLTSLLLSIPNIIIFVIVSIVSSVFISIDLPKIKNFFIRQIPAKYQVDFIETKDFIVNKILRIIRAYIVILFITFAELYVGFLFLNIQNAFLIAMLVSLLDLLPIIGTATYLVPWGLITIFGGENYAMGIGLIVLAVIISIIREVIQPRIVGSQIGLNPLMTLISIYVGLKIFGIVGLFIMPIILIFIKNLNDSGRISLWKNENTDSIKKPK